MPTLWRQEDGVWHPTAPSGFPKEEILHNLVETAPNMLPIVGAPRLTIIGRETPLGSGLADLVAVEPDGRPVVIEIKLERNSEAKRAVVAQVLSYAAALYGMTAEELEAVCTRYLEEHNFASIADAVRARISPGHSTKRSFGQTCRPIWRRAAFVLLWSLMTHRLI